MAGCRRDYRVLPARQRREALAKTKQTTGTGSQKQPRRKALLKKLERAQASHQKAEAKIGTLRVRLERAEARQAQVSQRLMAIQVLLDQAKQAKPPVTTTAKKTASRKHAEAGKRPSDASGPKVEARAGHAPTVAVAALDTDQSVTAQNGVGAASVAPAEG
jgi:chromosome segregation ATPase